MTPSQAAIAVLMLMAAGPVAAHAPMAGHEHHEHQTPADPQAGDALPIEALGLGGLYAFNFVPRGLEASYGSDPDGAMAFVRIKLE